ncbi:transposase [Patescibacteria group bacterium]
MLLERSILSRYAGAMPVKNVIKEYKKDSYYHIYNIGIESRTIFEDNQDYQTFINYLEHSLVPPRNKQDLQKTITIKGNTFKGSPRQPKNFYGQLELHAFCLMPTHFHFLVKQRQQNGIETFMRSLGTRYVMYFNKRHGRRGPLFQGTYKATDIKNEAMLLHLSRYIHRKPLLTSKGLETPHSSYAAYTNKHPMDWVTTKEINEMLDRDGLLKSINPTYKHFIELFKEDSKKVLGDLILED